MTRPPSDSPLALARVAAGFQTQEAAARRAGMPTSQWGDLECGRRPDWRLSTWRKIALVIGVEAAVQLFREAVSDQGQVSHDRR